MGHRLKKPSGAAAAGCPSTLIIVALKALAAAESSEGGSKEGSRRAATAAAIRSRSPQAAATRPPTGCPGTSAAASSPPFAARRGRSHACAPPKQRTAKQFPIVHFCGSDSAPTSLLVREVFATSSWDVRRLFLYKHAVRILSVGLWLQGDLGTARPFLLCDFETDF